MCIAYNIKIKSIPYFEMREIPLPELVDNPFSADMETVERIKGSIMFGPNYY